MSNEKQTSLWGQVPAPMRAEAETLLGRVAALMLTGPKWWTLDELGAELRATWDHGASDASISARLRDLRKPAHGGYQIQRRRREGIQAVVYEYRMLRGLR